MSSSELQGVSKRSIQIPVKMFLEPKYKTMYLSERSPKVKAEKNTSS